MAGEIAQVGQMVIDPMVNFGNSLVASLPGLIAAAVVLVVGYVIALLVAAGSRKALDRTKLERWLVKSGRLEALGGLEPLKVVGSLVKWWVFIAFLTPAANLVQLPLLASLLQSLAKWLPHLLGGVVIVIIGLLVADWAADSISAAKKLRGIRIISPAVRVLIIIYFVTMALKEIGLRVVLAEQTLLIFLGGIVLAVSLALGLGLGFGIRKQAEKVFDKIIKKI